jgi:hypothetical protein
MGDRTTQHREPHDRLQHKENLARGRIGDPALREIGPKLGHHLRRYLAHPKIA